MSPHPQSQPAHTRRGRAQLMLNLPTSILHKLTTHAPLAPALDPFRCNATTSYDVAAFIHAFGRPGPLPSHWRALFKAAGLLRPEDLAVAIAFVACEQPYYDVVREAVLGRDTPAIVDRVCELWDEWLVEDAVRMIGDRAEREACEWGVESAADGFVWRCAGTGDGVLSKHLLGESIDIVGMRVSRKVMGTAFEELLSRASFGGAQKVFDGLGGLGGSTGFVNGVVGRAKAVLVDRMFNACAQERICC